MITIQRNLVEMMAKTNLATDSKTKETFNKIIYNAFEKSDTNLFKVLLYSVLPLKSTGQWLICD